MTCQKASHQQIILKAWVNRHVVLAVVASRWHCSPCRPDLCTLSNCCCVFLTSLPNRKFTRCCRRAGTPRDRLSRGSSSTRPCSTSRPAPCSSSPQPGPRAQSNLVITELCAGGVRGREGREGVPDVQVNFQQQKRQKWFLCGYFEPMFIGFALRRTSIVPIS